MKTTVKRPLRLNRETMKNLTPEELGRVAGGRRCASSDSNTGSCPCTSM